MTIPAHAELIQAMCAFDLLGFQTEADRTASLTTCCATPADRARQRHAARLRPRGEDRRVPIGVHVDEVRAQAEAPANRRFATRLRANLLERLILSVDRWTIPRACASASRRLSAFWKTIRTGEAT